MIDVGNELDVANLEIERLKQSEKRVQESIEEMQQKFNFIRAKTETKLFSALPDLP